MISAPSQSNPTIQRDATQFVVLLGPNDGTRPTIDDEIGWLEPLSVQISAGAHRVDAIKLRVNFIAAAAAGVIADGVLQDWDLAFQGFNSLIEIRATDEDGNFTQVLGWGKLGVQSLEIGTGQKGVLCARLDPFLFGDPLEGYPVANPDGDDDDDVDPIIVIDDKVVFNPLIDHHIQGNMSSAQIEVSDVDQEDDSTEDDEDDDEPPEDDSDDPAGDGEDDGDSYNVFLDPESMLTEDAQVEHPDETISLWDMASAVNFLCQWLNGDEDYIQNPDLNDLQEVFADFDDSQLRNMSIPLGKFLPEALDALLKPFGYWWYLSNSTDDDDPDGPSQSTITIFQRGQGDAVQVFAARNGDPINLQNTNFQEFKCEVSLAHMANIVDGASDLGKCEGTWPLYPAWDPTLNTTAYENLSQDNLADNPNLIDVGRKWSCNEAGDYTTGNGDEEDQFGETGLAIDLLDLTDAFGEDAVQAKRRRLLHALSLDGPAPDSNQNESEPSGHSIGILIEWFNYDTQAWEKLTDGKPSILRKEMGLYFDDYLPPWYLWGYATQEALSDGSAGNVPPGVPDPVLEDGRWPFGLRITATVQTDTRTWGHAARQEDSPNGADVPLVLDLSHQYPWRFLAQDGDYQSQYAQQDGVAADTYDPTNPPSGVDIQTYVQTLRDWQDAAILSTSIRLDAASHFEYAIGQVVTAIAGRNIQLNAHVDSADGMPRNPQIVGINFLLGEQQKMELVLETFRREEFPELEDKGEGRHSHGQSTVKHVATVKPKVS